jgi:gluconolactonase
VSRFSVVPVATVALAVSASAQNFNDIRIETVAANLKYAEGPVWSLDGFLLFGDSVTNVLHKFTPGKGVEVAGNRPGGPAGNAYDSDGRLYSCEFRERRVVRVAKNGKVDVVASRFEGKRLNAPNDIVVREDGNAYFTDPAFGNQQDTKELDFYGVYRIQKNGEMEAIARWKTRPNGIALAPNGRILYVSDSDSRSVKAFDLDRGGKASNERLLIANVPGVPGGIRTDVKGNLWVAGKELYAYSPKGELLHEIPLGETPSNVAFGDADLESLYVTAHTLVYRLRPGIKGALPYAP